MTLVSTPLHWKRPNRWKCDRKCTFRASFGTAASHTLAIDRCFHTTSRRFLQTRRFFSRWLDSFVWKQHGLHVTFFELQQTFFFFFFGETIGLVASNYLLMVSPFVVQRPSREYLWLH
jgi:hypothetical protein